MQHEYYIIYKTTNPRTGEYYIGQHRTNNLQDGYKGSGNWVKAHSRKLGQLITEILKFSTQDQLKDHERSFIGDLWSTDPLCMNECPGGGSGPHTENAKSKIASTRRALGLKPDPLSTKNTTFMHKEGVQRRVKADQVDLFEAAGWVKGRLTKPPLHQDTMWVNDGTICKKVPKTLQDLPQGWVVGRLTKPYEKVKCSHCDVEGGKNVMKRYHFDRCKHQQV
jgi:hypothetical protein